MAGIKIWECKLESKSDSVRQGEGYCFKQEESNLITFTFTCSFLYLCLHVFASVLDKDSSELKVLAITINSKVKQAFECSREQSSSSYSEKVIILFVFVYHLFWLSLYLYRVAVIPGDANM